MAKHGLYSICFQQLISVADTINPNLRWDTLLLRSGCSESYVQRSRGQRWFLSSAAWRRSCISLFFAHAMCNNRQH